MCVCVCVWVRERERDCTSFIEYSGLVVVTACLHSKCPSLSISQKINYSDVSFLSFLRPEGNFTSSSHYIIGVQRESFSFPLPFSSEVSDRLLGPPSLILIGYRWCLSGGRATVMWSWSFTCRLRMSVSLVPFPHAVYRDGCTLRPSVTPVAEVTSWEGTWPFHPRVSYFILCDLSLRRLIQAAHFLLGKCPIRILPEHRPSPLRTFRLSGLWRRVNWQRRSGCSKSLQLPVVHDVKFQVTRFFHSAAMRT